MASLVSRNHDHGAARREENRRRLTQLFAAHHRRMYGLIRQIVADRWAAEDLLQDVLVRMMERADRLPEGEEERLLRYVCAACRNRAKNYLRSQRIRRKHTAAVSWETAEPGSGLEELERRLIRQEEMNSLRRIWGQLDRRSRYLLRHYYLLGESAGDIALQLGMKPASVRMALSRARKAAQRLMAREQWQDPGPR